MSVFYEKVRFATQYVRPEGSEMFCHEISDDDCAIPDLSYTIQELRRKFTLHTEILMAQRNNPGRFMFESNDGFLTESDENEMFDAPPASVPRNYDLVDQQLDREAIRNAVVRLRDLKNASRQASSSSVSKASTSTEPSDSGRDSADSGS